MCVHIENPLFSELRIAYSVRAGETATFQLRYPPEKSRFQTGFTLNRLANENPRTGLVRAPQTLPERDHHPLLTGGYANRVTDHCDIVQKGTKPVKDVAGKIARRARCRLADVFRLREVSWMELGADR